jgi:hypothetical protein
MEKVLLVASLIGTVHLFVLAVGRFGHLAFSPPVATPEHWPGAQKIPEWHRSVSASSLVSHDDGEEDWSKYDVPAFIPARYSDAEAGSRATEKAGQKKEGRKKVASCCSHRNRSPV